MELLLNDLAITGAEDYKVIDFTLHMDFFYSFILSIFVICFYFF